MPSRTRKCEISHFYAQSFVLHLRNVHFFLVEYVLFIVLNIMHTHNSTLLHTIAHFSPATYRQKFRGSTLHSSSKCYNTHFFYITRTIMRGGGLGSRPKKMYGERLDDGVEYHLMSPTPRRYIPFTTGRRAH